MAAGTIVFVHGTGVRLKGYQSDLADARKHAGAAGIDDAVVECAWGDPLGAVFEGLSLPDPPTDHEFRADAEDFAQWTWRFDDPLFELQALTTLDTPEIYAGLPPAEMPPWRALWERIAAYQPSVELSLVLKRSGLKPFWQDAWSAIIESDIAQLAFERSAHQLPEASNALARAVVAELHVRARAAGRPGPDRRVRESLVLRMLNDWDQVVYGVGGLFAAMFKRAATRALRRHREALTDMAALRIGDILLYQSRGDAVRDFIRQKVASAKPPVTLVAHSLGGIACFDLLALPNPPAVARLVTVGSQAPFFYEVEALVSLKPPEPLPARFPPWLNIYDRNDFLSYVASRLFPVAEDIEVHSGQPFPESHGNYFVNDEVWKAVRDFAVK
jgi:hypothetical protein